MKTVAINRNISNEEIYQLLTDKKFKNIHFQDFDDRMGYAVNRDIEYLMDFIYGGEKLWDSLCPKHKENTEYKANIMAIAQCAKDLKKEREKIDEFLKDLKKITSLQCYEKITNLPSGISTDAYTSAQLLRALYIRLAFIKDSQEKGEIKQKIEDIKKVFKKNLALLSIIFNSKHHVIKDGHREVKVDISNTFSNEIFNIMNNYRRDLNALGWFLKYNKFFSNDSRDKRNIDQFVDDFDNIKNSYSEIYPNVELIAPLTPLQIYGYDKLKFPINNKYFLGKRPQVNTEKYYDLLGKGYVKGSQTVNLQELSIENLKYQ